MKFPFYNTPRSDTVEFVIAGLGNPGHSYEGSRHNMGFLVADTLSEKYDIPINKMKFQGLFGMGQITGKRVVLLKPQLFMNLSGLSVRDCLSFFHLPPERAIIIYDDVSLPVGKLRVRAQGSDGGHNGIKDIIYQLRSDAFPRVKIGVGNPPDREFDLKDWVLSGFSASERKLMTDAVDRACDAVNTLITAGPDEAMNQFNG